MSHQSDKKLLKNGNAGRRTLSDDRKVRHVTVTARDLDQVERALLRTQTHFALAEGCSTVSCYEAGRDGFWLHRYLQSQGIDNWWWTRPVWKWTDACGGPKLTGLMLASS